MFRILRMLKTYWKIQRAQIETPVNAVEWSILLFECKITHYIFFFFFFLVLRTECGGVCRAVSIPVLVPLKVTFFMPLHCVKKWLPDQLLQRPSGSWLSLRVRLPSPVPKHRPFLRCSFLGFAQGKLFHLQSTSTREGSQRAGQLWNTPAEGRDSSSALGHRQCLCGNASGGAHRSLPGRRDCPRFLEDEGDIQRALMTFARPYRHNLNTNLVPKYNTHFPFYTILTHRDLPHWIALLSFSGTFFLKWGSRA